MRYTFWSYFPVYWIIPRLEFTAKGWNSKVQIGLSVLPQALLKVDPACGFSIVLPCVSCLTVLEADGRSSPWNHLQAQLWYLAKTPQTKRNDEKWQETVKKWQEKCCPELIRMSKNWEPPWQETMKQIKGKTLPPWYPFHLLLHGSKIIPVEGRPIVPRIGTGQ